MTLVHWGPNALATLSTDLRGDRGVVIPFPSPLPYAIAALKSSTVNALKGRPLDQPCGVLLSTFDSVSDSLALPSRPRSFAAWLTEKKMINVLVPVATHAPAWVHSAASKGWFGLTCAWIPQLRPLAAEGPLFVSSCNESGADVCLTAASADIATRGAISVLDGVAWRDHRLQQGSATMMRISPSGEAEVVRAGIQNRGLDNKDLLAHFRREFDESA